MANQKKLNLSKKEWFWYILTLFLAFVGLVFAIIGIIGDHLPVKASENWVRVSEKAWLTNWSPLGYRYWGIVLLAGGLIIFALALTLFSRESDRDNERAIRRAQRLAAMSEAENVVEAEEAKQA
ncbi:MAG: hypothetical protein IJU64_06730 [Bacilli bacterium]|nr:hypothetical protein [Bacilli bacterium]